MALRSARNSPGALLCSSAASNAWPRAVRSASISVSILFAVNRQSECFVREGVDPSVSTIADWVGTCTVMLAPLVQLIDAHAMAAAHLHGDDTIVPLLARDKTVIARLWTYVRDDQTFGGPAPPAAMFRYSRDRTGEHPQRHLYQRPHSLTAAQSRVAMEVMRAGSAVRELQALQHASTMASEVS